MRSSLTHAGADFKDGRRMASERLVDIQQALVIRNAELRSELLQRTRLPGRYAPGARDEAADAMFGRIVEEGFAGFVFGHAGIVFD